MRLVDIDDAYKFDNVWLWDNVPPAGEIWRNIAYQEEFANPSSLYLVVKYIAVSPSGETVRTKFEVPVGHLSLEDSRKVVEETLKSSYKSFTTIYGLL